MDNLILRTDSYKLTHWCQYPPNTTNVYSYLESRGGKFKDTVFFGLQYYLRKYLEGIVVTKEHIDEAEKFAALHFGDSSMFNRAGWEHIVENHRGHLPVVIRAVPEGTPVPVKTPLMTVENTDPKCYWLTNCLETLLVQVWYATTVATQSREMKRTILEYLEKTGDPAGIGFKLHDFGFRGVSSVESAGTGAAGHLVNFLGTDTIEGVMLARKYYDCEMAGHSIPASEHSTITSWGRNNEVDAFENMLTKYPTGLVACVSDSYDIFYACKQYWGKDLKDKVVNRDGTLVVRPDSGEPEEVVPQVLNTLGEAFGYSVNAKGYKVLNPRVRVIQGDGIDYESCRAILDVVAEEGWSTDNLAFGMGGALLQRLDRDTQKFAFKCSSIVVNGIETDVWKKPTNCNWKVSKPGRFNVGPEVFRDGKVVKSYSFDEVRANAALNNSKE